METQECEIREYLRPDGKCPFRNWLRSLKDVKARARIRVRINRIRLGNFGDCKPVGSGVSEFRFDYGPGYRVYFGRVGEKLVLLICADPKGIRKKILNSLKNIGLIIKGEKMSKTSTSYRKRLLKDLKDNEEAAAYLNASLEDESKEVVGRS